MGKIEREKEIKKKKRDYFQDILATIGKFACVREREREKERERERERESQREIDRYREQAK